MKFRNIMISILGVLVALVVLQGCMVTEDCTREGLAVYTRVSDVGCNYSVCMGGKWVDFEARSIADHAVFAAFPECNTIACYEKQVDDCECIETYDRFKTEN